MEEVSTANHSQVCECVGGWDLYGYLHTVLSHSLSLSIHAPVLKLIYLYSFCFFPSHDATASALVIG